jgi:hypothetical protein
MQSTEAKQAAVEQWTSDPCGYDSDHEPGLRPHMEDLDAGERAGHPAPCRRDRDDLTPSSPGAAGGAEGLALAVRS